MNGPSIVIQLNNNYIWDQGELCLRLGEVIHEICDLETTAIRACPGTEEKPHEVYTTEDQGEIMAEMYFQPEQQA